MYKTISGFRLLFAKALNDNETAIVIDTGTGTLLGGVVVLLTFDMSVAFEPYADLNMRFRWVWYKIVAKSEDFERERGWEHPPTISEMKYLKGPKYD